MWLINKETQERIFSGDLRRMYPNSLFSSVIRQEDVEPLGLQVLHNKQPKYNHSTEKLVDNGIAIIDGEYYIDYQVIPLTPQDVIVNSISNRQARLWLIDNDEDEVVINIINEISDDKLRKKALAEFEYAIEFERGNETLNMILSLIGKTPKDIDQMFYEASLL